MRANRSARVAVPAALLCRAVCLVTFLAAAACGDGGTGAGNPTPGVTHLDPVKLLQYSDSVRVTVTGSSFVQGAVVRLNGNARLTTYVSPSQLTAVVPAELMQQAGTVQVSVFNPEPRGGASNDMALPVEHRVPDLLFLEPAGAQQGGEAFVLMVNGAGFSQGAVVRWNGADRPTTFMNQGLVTAQIPATDLGQVGTAQITVFNPAPGGGTAAPRVFTISARPNPVPQLTELSPATIVAGTGATFTITGTGFVTGAQVFVGGFTPATTVVSPTQVQFTLQGSNLPNPGMAVIFVRNPEPGGGNSNPLQLAVSSPAPTLTALSPAEATVRDANLPVRLTGTGFMTNSTVLVNDQPRPAQRISATELEVVLSSLEARQPGTFTFRVSTPQPGGGVSSPLTLSIVNPAPVAQSLSPSQADAGQDSLVVRVAGTGFIPSSVVRADGTARTTRYVSTTALDVLLTADDLKQGGTVALTVANAAPGGGTSQALNLTLAVPVPVLESLSSSGASAGGPGFALGVNGTGFLRTTEVRWNGTPRTTRYISNTRLEIDVSDADVASPGTGSVTVHTPGGGTTAARQITIRSVGAATATLIPHVPFPAGDIVYDPHSGRLYASLTSAAGDLANTVVAIDPATGEVANAVAVGSNPGQLALSDDGSTLWVALGTGEVRRLSLPGLTPGLTFSLGSGTMGVMRAEDMRVMPGRPGTVAVSLMYFSSPRHAGVAIYDDGVRRAGMTQDHTGSNTITFGENASVLYGYNTETSEFGFRTIQVTDGGVRETRVTWDVAMGFGLQYFGGRVYGAGREVIDVSRHAVVGMVGGGAGAMALDGALGRVFHLDTDEDEVRVFDINNFQLLGRIPTGFLKSEHPALARERIVRWGTDGLAVSDGSGIYLYRSPVAGP